MFGRQTPFALVVANSLLWHFSFTQIFRAKFIDHFAQLGYIEARSHPFRFLCIVRHAAGGIMREISGSS